MRNHAAGKQRRRQGLTLIEAILFIVILGIVSLGFGIGLQSNARVPGAVDLHLSIHTRLVEKMEDLESLDFATLAANSGLSDTVTIGGTVYTRTVGVAYFDADGVNGVENDIVQVTVTIGTQSLKTLVTKP